MVIAITVVLGIGCGGSAAPPRDVGVEMKEAMAFQGRIEIDAKPGGKRFQGVWLATGDERYLLSYRKTAFWEAFEGQAVGVDGEVYAPQGQAIAATHLRVDRIVCPSGRYATAGPVEEREGEFAFQAGAPGSKREGERIPTLSAGSERFELLTGELPEPGRYRVEGRVVELSPYAAHSGGPFLIPDSFRPLGD